MGHTILLMQLAKAPQTRTFKDFKCVDDCLSGICKIYEEHLKRVNPSAATLTYDPDLLYQFLDELWDVNLLIYQEDAKMYAPYNKEWIKEKIYIYLLGAVMVKDS